MALLFPDKSGFTSRVGGMVQLLNIRHHYAMTTTKQRRYLKILFIISLILWLVWTFGPIVFWHAKGGLPAPTTKTVSTAEYDALLDWFKDTLFHEFPSAAGGYFIIAMLVLDLIVKTKPTKDDDRDA
jgi:hypothetical protein